MDSNNPPLKKRQIAISQISVPFVTSPFKKSASLELALMYIIFYQWFSLCFSVLCSCYVFDLPRVRDDCWRNPRRQTLISRCLPLLKDLEDEETQEPVDPTADAEISEDDSEVRITVLLLIAVSASWGLPNKMTKHNKAKQKGKKAIVPFCEESITHSLSWITTAFEENFYAWRNHRSQL